MDPIVIRHPDDLIEVVKAIPRVIYDVQIKIDGSYFDVEEIMDVMEMVDRDQTADPGDRYDFEGENDQTMKKLLIDHAGATYVETLMPWMRIDDPTAWNDFIKRIAAAKMRVVAETSTYK